MSSLAKLAGQARRWTVAGARYSLLQVARARAESAPLQVLHYQFRNWGDAINPVLVELLSGQRVRSVDIDARRVGARPSDPSADTLYAVVGSILHHVDTQTIVWGPGFESAGLKLRQPPKEVRAVRGPLTAAALRGQGVSCPDVFGDPVLLLPRYVNPPTPRKVALGIVPHFNDLKSPRLARFREHPEVRIIDMRGPLWATLKALCECERIVSSSLHGLILADAYGIPSVWARLSDRIPGGNFKFLDYYASIGHALHGPELSLETETFAQLWAAARPREVALDLDALLRACPFY